MFANNRHLTVAWILFAGILGAYLLMAFRFPHAYIIATYEDLVGEWAQVFLFSFTMLLAARQAFVSARFRLFFGLLALACLYVAGEEISWGQRLFEIQTPEFFSEHNLQNETNLHNFFTGPINTLLKQFLEYVIAAALIGYGLVYPWLLRRRVGICLWLERKGLAAPPLYLSPFFVLSGLLELGIFHFNEAEIAEILIPFALAVMTLSYGMSARQKVDPLDHRGWKTSYSTRLAAQTLLLFCTVLFLAVVTTLACYSSPELGAEMEDRYLTGVEKFAGRYKRFEQWETAARLYLQVQQREPERASLRRNLFRCYEKLEQGALAQTHLDAAIEIDLLRLERNPDSISANISLVRNYQLSDDIPNQQKYLQQALDIGLARKAVDPQDHRTAYWLGESYVLQGDYVSACQEYRRSVRLKPDSLRYKKALLTANRLLAEKGKTSEV